ncbi:MAG TPA: hypothetical protein VH120_19205, partial [Gemmataceae bacterium]|nr:hypothetical protein [Gemmataceae bacterium]
MIRFRGREWPGLCLAVLTTAIFAGIADAQILFVASYGNNTVGKYDAVTGAAINSTFINGQGLNSPGIVAIDGNRLFVNNLGTTGFEPPNYVSQYDATTGTMLNANFATVSRYITGLAGDGRNQLFTT